MNQSMLLIVSLCLFTMLLFIIIISFTVEINNKKRNELKFKKTIADLENKLNQKHFRRDYRLEFTMKECIFEINKIGDRKFDQSEKKGKGNILDMSRSGLKLQCPYDLPVRKKIILSLTFNISEHPFTLTGKIVRKEESLDEIMYGIQFIGNDKKILHQLAQQLQKVQAEKLKKEKKTIRPFSVNTRQN